MPAVCNHSDRDNRIMRLPLELPRRQCRPRRRRDGRRSRHHVAHADQPLLRPPQPALCGRCGTWVTVFEQAALCPTCGAIIVRDG